MDAYTPSLKSQKKSPTVFYWLSLVTAVGAIVVLFFDWFAFQVASFGIDNLPTQYYGLMDVETFLNDAGDDKSDSKDFVYIDIEGDPTDTWVPTAAKIGLFATLAAEAIYLLTALICARRTTPRGIIFLGGGIPIVMGGGFLVVFGVFSNYIASHQIDELVYIEFLDLISIFPFALVMLGVATVVFALIDRQERLAMCAVKNPRPIVFPPENPETV